MILRPATGAFYSFATCGQLPHEVGFSDLQCGRYLRIALESQHTLYTSVEDADLRLLDKFNPYKATVF